jgi:nicotinic acid mononucleotide adenylyltransferase
MGGTRSISAILSVLKKRYPSMELDRVLFILQSTRGHRPASLEDRFRMTEIATATIRFEVSRYEIDKSRYPY